MNPATDDLFRALGDPTRRALYEHICAQGETTVGSLTDVSGVSQPVVSRHLGVLKAAKLVRPRPDGRRTFYRADPEGLRDLGGWVARMSSFWSDKLDDLEHWLEADTHEQE